MIDEFRWLLDDEGKYLIRGGARSFPGLKQALVVRNLDFAYDSERGGVLSGVTLTVPAGRVTALIGASGAGKSTFVSLLLRFYDCPPASIFLDGTDIREFDIDSLRKRIAFVGQEAFLFNGTLRENLCYGAENPVPADELKSIIRRARLEEVIERLPSGLDENVGERGIRLSGGERQRVTIARALLCNSDILILDEPTSALDGESESQVVQSLTALRGLTVLMISHRHSTIELADHVVELAEGRVLLEQTGSEWLRKTAGLRSAKGDAEL